MTANTLPGPSMSLGGFLRDRRARLAPTPGQRRRRTPGLRREEVASRAGVSVTWYTWLEQGRGGPPSSAVLERLASARELDPSGREILFLLAQQRPPPGKRSPVSEVAPAVQRVLDALVNSPAFIRTSSWDVVAWNAAALAVLGDYRAVSVEERNILRRLFGNPALRPPSPDWEAYARAALAVFRIDVARAGGSAEAVALVEELQASSPDFRRLWAENEMHSHGSGSKHFDHPTVGPFTVEYAAFAVDGDAGLTMIVFTPSSPADAQAVETLIASRPHLA
jgi:transcriptional regulator with XRE-family HTH domain